MEEITSDNFFNGRIRIRQKRGGYRFSSDAVLLAHGIKNRTGLQILDLGTGCGIIPLILAYRNPTVRICGIEVQKELADIALLNVAENQMQDRIVILHGDLKQLYSEMIPGPVDIVVSNPPYRKVNAGRINPDPQKAVAMHEIKAALEDIIQTACRVLDLSGKFLTIYPVQRVVDLLEKMRFHGIEPKRLRMIHANAESEARRVLVEGVKGGRPGVTIDPPLIIYSRFRTYSEEITKMLAP
ncbi:MAG: tRNA1(Val) (adenine(37)-N6)-methyltransferase [Desulfobacterales bacterium]|nr:tRNA1(Val) (adenine(37)-N6)-methyltransferase [Desulfobacterales bacterium]